MSLVMTYPVVTPTSTVTLPNPQLGNTQRLNTFSNHRKSIGGEVKGVKDSTWPNHKTHIYKFAALKNNDSNSELVTLKAFLILTAGLQIKIVDHNSETWHGFIMSQTVEIVTIVDDCSYEVSFEFFGVKQ